MSSLVSPVLEPVSDLKFSHFQASRQHRALVACQVLLAGKYFLEILELTLCEMAAVSSFLFWDIFGEALYCLRFLKEVFVVSTI